MVFIGDLEILLIKCIMVEHSCMAATSDCFISLTIDLTDYESLSRLTCLVKPFSSTLIVPPVHTGQIPQSLFFTKMYSKVQLKLILCFGSQLAKSCWYIPKSFYYRIW